MNNAALTGLNAEPGFFFQGQANLTGLSEETARLQLDGDRALKRMEAADLIRRDPNFGAVSVASYMLNKPVMVTSHDPQTGDEVRVRVDPDPRPIDATPDEAVALAGHVSGAGALAPSCCPVTNFFASETNAPDYLARHSGIDGQIVSIAQAADAGRALFGRLLTAS